MKKNALRMSTYKEEEQFLYNKTYLFIKGYATGLKLTQTLKALPLVRQFHSEQYRKNKTIVDGKEYQLPYVLHVLKVCSTLISLELPLSKQELDVLLTAALLHDTIEDANDYISIDGHELIDTYHFSEDVLNCVKLVTKCHGCTDEQLDDYFENIKTNKLAILVKLADRSHNVEDIYVMKIEKLHGYVRETRRWIYPLASYGKANFPELSNGFTILKSKIVSLTECTETIVAMYQNVIAQKDKEIAELKLSLQNKKGDNKQ